MQRQPLPIGKQILYAFGMMGWSIMINLIGVILLYLYVPPNNSGLPVLISQVVFFGIFNLMFFITASGRLVDAFVDPVVAQLSDRSNNPNGRRIPFMKRAILPSLVFCLRVFFPLKPTQSAVNVIWLMLMLVGFYISSTAYIIPYSALLPELAPEGKDKVQLSSFQSLGYVFGIGIASNIFNVADKLQHSSYMLSRLASLQCTVAIFAFIAAICMAVTAWSIDEKKYSVSKPSAVPLKQALRQTLSNKNFRFFIVADFSYIIGVTLITSGLLYFVTVLLRLPETIGNSLMITMVLCSFIFYPIVNILSKKIGKKPIVIFSLIVLSLVFAGIYFLGRFNIDAKVQIYSLIVLASIPVASLNILPVALLAEIIAKDTLDTGSNKEGIYFAVRYFFVKIGQTFGIAVFALLLIHGKDVGNDFGIRLNGALGFILCVAAATTFSWFKEVRGVENLS